MSFIPYPPSVYNLDYDRVKEFSNRIYIQREEFRKNLDKLHALRTTIGTLTLGPRLNFHELAFPIGSHI